MAVMIKCKMCGGDLKITEGNTVCECEYCGTKQTVPTLDNEKKLTLFSRAGRLLRNCEFDKASGVFESIVAEFPEEAEAYWGLVLCKYGIEYVDDPATGKKIPTCHRSSFESVLDDTNYEQACENTDAVARRVYRDEARQLEELRKSIIEVSGKEEPYDIFISYKETDENGNRTLDSVIAQDIYTELTEKGYRVFFSRISLEDKLGVEYEPYIFAALNSAKVMLVVGTDYDNFDAVWVKNEWSRFLKLIASGQKKVLIPVFKNMDPYDMPREFSKLAAQDMGKVGAMQDLLRGIDKLFDGKQKTASAVESSAQTVNVVSANPTVTSLLERAFMFLEDGNFEKADEYAEKVLDIEPKNARAYLCKLMEKLKVQKQEELKEKQVPFDNEEFYNKAIQFGDPKLVNQLKEYNTYAKKKAEEVKREAEVQKNERIINLKNELKNLNIHKDSIEDSISDIDKETLNRFLQLKRHAEENLDSKRIKLKAAEPQIKRIEEIEKEIGDNRFYLGTLGALRAAEKNRVKKLIDGLAKEKYDLWNIIESLKVEIEEVEKQEQKAKADYNTFRAKKEVELERLNKNKYYKIASEILELEEFGNYQGKKIEWIILAIEGTKVLLLSKYALDCQPYNEGRENVTWERSSIRHWLNDSFLNSAFTVDEQKQILVTTVIADKNPNYNTNPGNNTNDKIFLLSIAETDKFFSSDSERICEQTNYAYAKSRDIYPITVGYKCYWWLRSPGNYQNTAAIVGYLGSIQKMGKLAVEEKYAVRPALWVNLGE